MEVHLPKMGAKKKKNTLADPCELVMAGGTFDLLKLVARGLLWYGIKFWCIWRGFDFLQLFRKCLLTLRQLVRVRGTWSSLIFADVVGACHIALCCVIQTQRSLSLFTLNLIGTTTPILIRLFISIFFIV